MNHATVNYDEKPILIFWETTKACNLACKHCRASALVDPLPDEMSLDQSLAFLEQVTEFGKPYPVVIMTGGDVMKKKGLREILSHARDLDIPVSLSPSATPLLNESSFSMMREMNVRFLSLSLDGATPSTHDWLRGLSGTFDRTMKLIEKISKEGFTLQINTTVFKRNVYELPSLLKILLENGMKTWEVFSLIRTGRGIDREDLEPREYEDVFNYLEFASRYGITVRTVEAPFFRRIILERQESDFVGGKLYNDLVKMTSEMLGEPTGRSRGHTTYTRDGKGVIFVAHNGDVNPSGFLPIPLGNVKERSIVDIYRNNETLIKLRDHRNLKGRCGICEYGDICGCSRARAYSYFNDIFQEDPRCLYILRSIQSLNNI